MGTGRQSYGMAVAYPRGAAQRHLCSPVSTVQILHCRTWPRVTVSSRADIWKSPCAETSKVEFPCSHKLALPHTHKCSPNPAGLALAHSAPSWPHACPWACSHRLWTWMVLPQPPVLQERRQHSLRACTELRSWMGCRLVCALITRPPDTCPSTSWADTHQACGNGAEPQP